MLERYPPAVGRVLKLDTSLMNNPAYLGPYPALSTFLAQHPEVVHNPGYFLENVNTPFQGYNDPRRQQRQEMYGLLAGVALFIGFLIVIGLIVWFVRLVITSRRWNKLSKVQYEVHSKLLDRFTANEDLLAYMQTPGWTQLPRIRTNSPAGRAQVHVGAGLAHPLVRPGWSRAPADAESGYST